MAKHPPYDANCTCPVCLPEKYVTRHQRIVPSTTLSNASQQRSNLPAAQPDPKDQRIAELVDRFLAWPLPSDVGADACATMPGYPHRTGTTLLTATQAEQMLSHVVSLILQEHDQLRAKVDAECRLNAMGQERELKLRARVTELEAKLERTKEHHFRQRQENDAIEQKVFDEMAQETGSLRARVQELESAYANAREMWTKWQAAAASDIPVINQLRTDLADARRNAAITCDQLRDARDAARAEVTTLRDEVMHLTCRCRGYEAGLEAARAECQRLEAETDDLQRKYGTASVLAEQYHSDAHKHWEANQRLEAQAARMREALECIETGHDPSTGEPNASATIAKQALAETDAGGKKGPDHD